VDWATKRWLPPLLERGVRVFLQPAPFSHSKLLIVDGAYAQIGSANMDLRSLRLNFEIAVEIYCAETCKPLVDYVLAAREHSALYPLDVARRQSLLARARNSLFWLLSPYL
jgi:cardiolipin synthase A/B